MTKQIKFNNIEDIYNFVEVSGKCEGNVYIENLNKEYKINGKSILGIFSLDLSQTLIITYDDSETELTKYLESLEK